MQVSNIETDLELALQEKSGTIKFTDLPVLEGASVLIYQLFYNLINNSIKFARVATALEIKISSTNILLHNEPYTNIRLQDNGIGFDSEYAEQIFDTFTRLNPKDDYEGTGLGLSLCKKIVERHGGKIIASGDPGRGALFTITLPLNQKEATL